MNLENQLEDFYRCYCPYGSLDIRAALKAADAVGQDSDWVIDLIEEFAESCGMKKDDLDVVYVVYDQILQEARQEIEDLVDIDICDGIDTAGNYLATSYDCTQEFIDKLKAAFEEKGLDIHSDDYNLSTQFLFDNINV